MNRKRLLLALGAVVVVGAGAGVAAPGDGDSDEPLRGSELEQASAAALKHTGGGTVVDSEVGDDGAAYGIEIRRGDGSQVEISLDNDFNVIGQESDDDGSEDGSDD